jgi:hypothetical protein
MSLGPAVKPCLCLAVPLIVLAACGTAGSTPKRTSAASKPAVAQGVTQSTVRVSPAGEGGCDQAVSTFAGEKRIADPERAALEALITSLDRYPVAFRCASSQITILARRPAGSNTPGKPDDACLAAANDIQALEAMPGVAAPVQHAARLAGAIVDATERHAGTFCVDP